MKSRALNGCKVWIGTGRERNEKKRHSDFSATRGRSVWHRSLQGFKTHLAETIGESNDAPFHVLERGKATNRCSALHVACFFEYLPLRNSVMVPFRVTHSW